MQIDNKIHSVALASVLVIISLILVSSTVSAVSAQNTLDKKAYAYITNHDSDSVSVIDTATNKIVVTINEDVGDTPIGVAINPQGTKVYVSNSGFNYSHSSVSVIDTATNKVTAKVPVRGVAFGIAITPNGKSVYVANWLDTTISVIDTAKNKVKTTIDVGGSPYDVRINPDGREAYVTIPEKNLVVVIDTAKNNVKTIINVGRSPNGLVFSPDGKKAYIANDDGTVSVIDTAKNKVVCNVNLDGSLLSVAVTPDGSRIYVTQYSTDVVYVIDTATNKVKASIPMIPLSIGQIAITPDGKKAYITTNDQSKSIAVIDTRKNKVISTISLGTSPQVLGLFIGCIPASNHCTKPLHQTTAPNHAKPLKQ